MQLLASINRIDKLLQALRTPRLLAAVIHHHVLAGAEHRHMLSKDLATVVDIGANRGQFALAVRHWAPGAKVISFEPLPVPAAIFRKVFSGDENVLLHGAAIGPLSAQNTMHVSARDDSSSLLPISALQSEMFPGTAEISTISVQVAPLETFVEHDEILAPAMLKLDVQGFELDALRGCESLLHDFEWVYCECSFVELYSGQALASDVISWLSARGFRLIGMFNPAYDKCGQTIQADFLFQHDDMDNVM